MLRCIAVFAAVVLADALLPDWDGIAPPGPPTRLALHAGAVFLGTESGLYRRDPSDGRGWSLVLAAEPILDLASSGPELFIATPAGLYVLASGRDVAVRLPLGAGDAARGLAVDAAGTVWVATAGGLFRRATGEGEFAREESVPSGEIAAVASAGDEVWVGVEGALYAGGTGRAFLRRLGGVDAGWFELRGATRSGGVTLLGVASGIWRIDRAGARQIELGTGVVSRIALAGGRVWVAAERGLYDYAMEELGTGAGKQALSVAALGLDVDGTRLWVATDRGLAAFALDPGTAQPPPRGVPGASPRLHAERIARLQRAVLEYQELAPARLGAIESRARWKGLYPQLRAGAGIDRGDEWNGGNDLTFSSGALHHLWDQGRSKNQGWDAAVTLTWELSDFVSPDDPLAVSRERRLVVSLRDQVLERVNHLYFQRVRALEQLAALPPAETGKRAELELTAGEIAAQLDAWSGGVFSRLEESSPLEDQREP
ncbi:MAG TPA: hypothetical protein VKF60_19415 [Myxococcota bacterium]|nr:hypothetical protein [Myxococcota bacterium]